MKQVRLLACPALLAEPPVPGLLRTYPDSAGSVAQEPEEDGSGWCHDFSTSDQKRLCSMSRSSGRFPSSNSAPWYARSSAVSPSSA